MPPASQLDSFQEAPNNKRATSSQNKRASELSPWLSLLVSRPRGSLPMMRRTIMRSSLEKKFAKASTKGYKPPLLLFLCSLNANILLSI